MATIHRIETETKRRGAAPAATQATVNTTADIILFPGVRYERWSETHQPAQSAKRSRKHRDRLDIAE
jgi:hypothetical protein